MSSEQTAAPVLPACYQTPEFWVTMVGPVLTVLAAGGYVHIGDLAGVTSDLGKSLAAVAFLAAHAAVVIRWLKSRGDLHALILSLRHGGPDILVRHGGQEAGQECPAPSCPVHSCRVCQPHLYQEPEEPGREA